MVLCGELRGLLRGNAINFEYKWDDVTSINRGPLAFSACYRRHRGYHGDKRAFKKTNEFSERGLMSILSRVETTQRDVGVRVCSFINERDNNKRIASS